MFGMLWSQSVGMDKLWCRVDTARIFLWSTFPSIDSNFFCESSSIFKGSLPELVHFTCSILGHLFSSDKPNSVSVSEGEFSQQKRKCLPGGFVPFVLQFLVAICFHHLIPVNVPFNALKSVEQCSKPSVVAL